MLYGFKILIPNSFTYKMEGLAVVSVTDFHSILFYDMAPPEKSRAHSKHVSNAVKMYAQ